MTLLILALGCTPKAVRTELDTLHSQVDSQRAQIEALEELVAAHSERLETLETPRRRTPLRDRPGVPDRPRFQIGDDSTITLDRATLTPYLTSANGFMRELRMLQHRGPDGEVDGHRLSAIRRGSFADEIGIKNGDIIHSLNGVTLVGDEALAPAVDVLQTAETYELALTRRGETLTLTFPVEDLPAGD